MTKSNQPIPPGHENLIPHLICDPCSEAIDFYKKAFGAEEIHRMLDPTSGRIMHASIRFDNCIVYLNDDFPETCGGQSQTAISLKGTPLTLHHYVKDCDAAFNRAIAAGATTLMPPSDMFWGDRYSVVVDPYGHRWSFATHQQDMSSAEMQAAVNDACAPAAKA